MKQKKTPLALLQTILHVNLHMPEHFGPSIKRFLKITAASGTANIIVGLGKLAMGVLSMSFFACINAFYTFGMVFAKGVALIGIVKAKNVKEQYRYYMISGTILTVSSLLYIAYSIRLFFHPENSIYHMYVALVIASFTFTELVINIRGVIMELHNHALLIHAIKMINLASSLICLVLTQTAILSFSDTKVESHAMANGLIGILMGSCAAMLGVIMIARINRIQSRKNYNAIYRTVKKLMKEEYLDYPIKPVKYIEKTLGEASFYVTLQKGRSKTEFKYLQYMVRHRLQIELIHTDDQELKQEE